VLPGLFFMLALVAGVGMYAFSSITAPDVNPLLATQGQVPRPVPVASASQPSLQVAAQIPATPASAPAPEPAGNNLAGRAESRQVTLYVVSKQDTTKLVPYTLSIDTAPGTRDLVDRVVNALQGPFEDPNMLPAVPKGTKLLSVFLMRKQMIVNLSRDIAIAHGGGTQVARLTIYSLVNSLIDLGLAEEVKILIQGREEMAFMDHMDLTRSLPFEQSIVLKPGDAAAQVIGKGVAAAGAAAP
jgi:hypothetical protein